MTSAICRCRGIAGSSCHGSALAEQYHRCREDKMSSSTLSAEPRSVGAEQRIAHAKRSETAGHRAAAFDADRYDSQARAERTEKALTDARQRIDQLQCDADALRRRAMEAERRAEDLAA